MTLKATKRAMDMVYMEAEGLVKNHGRDPVSEWSRLMAQIDGILTACICAGPDGLWMKALDYKWMLVRRFEEEYAFPGARV